MRLRNMAPIWLWAAALMTVLSGGVSAQTMLEAGDSAAALSEPVAAQGSMPNDTVAVASRSIVDTVILIPSLDFNRVRLADALSALARSYQIPLYVDSSVVGNISLRLDNVTLNDALLFMIKQYGMAWERTGGIVKVFKPEIPPPEPEPLDVFYTSGRLTMSLEKADIARLIDTLVDLTGRNIVLEAGTSGTLSGRIADLPLEEALRVLLGTNGFTFRKVDQVIYVGREPETERMARPRSVDIRCESGLVSVSVTNTPLRDVLAVLADQCGANIFVQTALEGTASASFAGKTLEESLTYLLINTAYSFKETGGIYFIGSRDSEDLYDSRLVRLKHLIAGNTIELIPTSLTKQVTVKVSKEHNGLVLTGPRTAIAGLESFLSKIDVPTAQVLFEVLVVDYSTTERAEFGITANNFGGDSILPGQSYYPLIDVSAVGRDLNDDLRSIERQFGWSNLGVLADDFFLRLQMLRRDGKANIRSHPQLAALNGHPASIEIGVTQYYLLESKTTYLNQSSGEPVQTAQRFETVEANMSLKVTPFVNAEEELTVDLEATFNSPAGTFDPDIPPTINRRILTSTVRLRNGETIVLGGLVQQNKSLTIDKLPILGSLPLIGRLFQNRYSNDTESELMIYMTPHVYYGSEGSINIEHVLDGK